MSLNSIIAERKDKIIYRDGNNAIKCFNENYSKSNILNEALNHARIEEAGLKVPRLISVSQIDGKWAITTEFIEGRTLEEMMNSENEGEGLNELMSMFIDLQLEVLSKNVIMLHNLKDKVKRKLNELNLDETIMYNVSARLETLESGDKVCHGDFNPSNIIIREDGAYILDWSHVSSGNSLYDVAATYLIFKINNQEKYADMYMNMVCDRMKVDKVEIQKWLPIVATVKLSGAKTEESKKILMDCLEAITD